MTFTPRHVVVEDADDNRYDLRGAAHFGGSYDAQRETVQQLTGTIKNQLVEHASSFGTCRSDFDDEH